MREVTRDELWDFVKDKNLVYVAEGNKWPYTGVYKTRSGDVVAKDVPFGEHIGISTDQYKYYIQEP